MIVDLSKPVRAATDGEQLKSLVTSIIGQRCLKADLSYGAELMLHLGDPVSYGNKRILDEQKGSWILGTRASSWRLLLTAPPMVIACGWPAEPGTLPRPLSGEEVENLTRGLAGQVIHDVTLAKWPLPTPVGVGIGVVVKFSGGADLVIVPSSETDGDDDPLPDWELFTPFHMYLRVGPGTVWSYLPSNVVEKATPVARNQ
jgi:hypothetical protein